MPIQLPYTGVTTTETIPAPFTNGGAVVDLTQKEDKPNKGVANGYAPLDANAKVPVANLPDTASLDAEVDGKITTHNSATTSVHGIANTANLVLTSDSRLSDTRDPKAHTHAPSEITGTAVVTNDSRLSDSRVPTSHTHGNITNAGAIGSTANLPVITTASGVVTTGTFGTTANSFCAGNDSRLSDSRTPTAHTHAISQVTNLQATLTAFAIALG